MTPTYPGAARAKHIAPLTCMRVRCVLTHFIQLYAHVMYRHTTGSYISSARMFSARAMCVLSSLVRSLSRAILTRVCGCSALADLGAGHRPRPSQCRRRRRRHSAQFISTGGALELFIHTNAHPPDRPLESQTRCSPKQAYVWCRRLAGDDAGACVRCSGGR